MRIRHSKKAFIVLLYFGGILLAGIVPLKLAQPLSPSSLKGYMYTFVTLAAELRMEGIKTEKPDWKAIRGTLEKMSQNLKKMQSADLNDAYKDYLEQVSFNLVQLKKMSKNQNPKIFEGFDHLTKSCLQCHSAHLPRESTLYKGKMN